MKRISLVIGLISVFSLIAGALAISHGQVALAAKPSGPDNNVIERSNGYPSGPHFNLNVHGKKDDYNCDPTPGGNSVFILEYGQSTLQYVSNKKSSVSELTAVDRCAEAYDGDPAKVQIPYEPQGYYVFATVKAKPQNGQNNGDGSSIVLTPDPVLELCNATSTTPDFGDALSCSDDEALLSLGLVTNNGVYKTDEQGFVRFDDPDAKGKGKSQATDITGLFTWTGYACDDILDVNGDGVIDELDVPLTYDANLDGVIDADELDAYFADLVLAGSCTYYEDEWVFNVADLVVQDQDINNDGVKLLKVRFYPVATTQYIQD